MARIWVKAGTKDKGGQPFPLPLEFRVQGMLTNKDKQILVIADGNVTSKIRDGSLVKCAGPVYKRAPEVKKTPETKKDSK